MWSLFLIKAKPDHEIRISFFSKMPKIGKYPKVKINFLIYVVFRIKFFFSKKCESLENFTGDQQIWYHLSLFSYSPLIYIYISCLTEQIRTWFSTSWYDRKKNHVARALEQKRSIHLYNPISSTQYKSWKYVKDCFESS